MFFFSKTELPTYIFMYKISRQQIEIIDRYKMKNVSKERSKKENNNQSPRKLLIEKGKLEIFYF